nr:MAG TPA: hypothetical protein [Caudoviricetes sp.]
MFYVYRAKNIPYSVYKNLIGKIIKDCLKT